MLSLVFSWSVGEAACSVLLPKVISALIRHQKEHQGLLPFGETGTPWLYFVSQGTGQMASKLMASDETRDWDPLFDE